MRLAEIYALGETHRGVPRHAGSAGPRVHPVAPNVKRRLTPQRVSAGQPPLLTTVGV